MVRSHNHTNACADSYDVGIDPSCNRVEGVDEAIALPGLDTVAQIEIAQAAHGFCGKKRDRARRSAGDDGSVEVIGLGRAAPNFVAGGGIGCSYAPGMLIVAGEAVAQGHTKRYVSAG